VHAESTVQVAQLGVPAQSGHSQSSFAISHMPSGMPPAQLATTATHCGWFQQSSQWQPSMYESQIASSKQASGGHTPLPKQSGHVHESFSSQ